MRYEDIQGKRATLQLGGGCGQMVGVVAGGDGDAIYLDVEEDGDTVNDPRRTVRYEIAKGQIIWMRKEEGT